MNKKEKKVIVIGIDGGTFDLIMPLIRDGKMPALASILKNGAWSDLLSTVPPVTAPAWSSFITGTSPGKHGVYYFFDQDINNYEINSTDSLVNSKMIKGIPFWRALNDNGKKAGLVNIPLTYPPEPLDGFMISGMLVPGGAKDYMYPPDLNEKLDDYYVDLDGLMENNEWQVKKLLSESKEKFVKSVYHMSEKRAENSLRLMREMDWDLFMVVFTGSDRLCHFFWEDHETGEVPSKIIADYFAYLDGLIGQLFMEAGSDAVKVIMSDHGFGKAASNSVNVHALMDALGCETFKAGTKGAFFVDRVMNKSGIRKKKLPLQDFIDWKGCKAYPTPMYNNYMGICINSENEKKWGTVAAGREYDLLRKSIADKLKSLVDPHSGEKIVENVYLREEIYTGPLVKNAPDIIVQFSYSHEINFKPLKKELVQRLPKKQKTGNHRRNGMLMVSGPGIRAGQLKNSPLIEDVTSTLLYLLDSEIPKIFDGRVIKDLFEEAHFEQFPPQLRSSDDDLEAGISNEGEFCQSEMEASKELLKNLGYM